MPTEPQGSDISILYTRSNMACHMRTTYYKLYLSLMSISNLCVLVVGLLQITGRQYIYSTPIPIFKSVSCYYELLNCLYQ